MPDQDTERQVQMEFMEAQALSIEIQKLLTDRKVKVIAAALSLTVGTFAATCGGDVEQNLDIIANASRHYSRAPDALQVN